MKSRPRARMLGMKTVMRKLRKEVDAIEGRTMKGLIRATIAIRTATEKQSPITPVDQGNLYNSWFTSTTKGVISIPNTGKFEGDNSVNLKNQHETVKQMASTMSKRMGKRQPVVTYGFSANYAFWVHENYNKKINWKRPGAGPGFFISSIKQSQKQVLEIIKREAQIK